MIDHFSECLTDYKAQLQTLSVPYFPAVTGRAAGWQVSENDLTPMEGGDYFIVLRPGKPVQVRHGVVLENEWHVTTLVFVRFAEYDNLWPRYRPFFSDILNLQDTIPLQTHGIWYQNISAQDEPKFVVDTKTGNFTDLVMQPLDATIRQRVKIR